MISGEEVVPFTCRLPLSLRVRLERKCTDLMMAQSSMVRVALKRHLDYLDRMQRLDRDAEMKDVLE